MQPQILEPSVRKSNNGDVPHQDIVAFAGRVRGRADPGTRVGRSDVDVLSDRTRFRRADDADVRRLVFSAPCRLLHLLATPATSVATRPRQQFALTQFKAADLARRVSGSCG